MLRSLDIISFALDHLICEVISYELAHAVFSNAKKDIIAHASS
jgi:hypothetical protein